MAHPRKPRPFTSLPVGEATSEALPAAPVDILDPVEEAVAATTFDAAEKFGDVVAAGTHADLSPHLPAAAPIAAPTERKAVATIEAGYKVVASGVQEIQTLTLNAVKENMEANLAFMSAFMQVKSLSEAVALQSGHARRQYDAVSAQWKNLAGAAQRIALHGADRLGTAG